MSLRTCGEDLFWYWIHERYLIWQRRRDGLPKPWSSDPIFQRYKFVNVFRFHDRTTEWLLDNWLTPHENDDPALIAFNICWYRMFNRWETGAALGWIENWNAHYARIILAQRKQVFTGAYIIHSDPGEPKLDSILRVCDGLWEMRKGVAGMVETGMRETWQYLQMQKHVGPFMAYQMVLDMMYTKLLENASDRETWTCTGPGAMRGLKRLDPAAKPSDSLERMIALRDRSRGVFASHRGLQLLTVHDIEFCLCELDKYCRVKYGEGRPRSTYPGGA